MSVQRVKLSVVGGRGVGKTCMLWRYQHGTFPDGNSTVPAELENFFKEIRLETGAVQLSVWDTVDREEYDRIYSPFITYRDSHVVLLVFAIDQLETLDSLCTKYIPQVKGHCSDDVVLVGVGMKCDLKQNDTMEVDVGPRAASTLLANGVHEYMECSALTGEGVQMVFEKAVQLVIMANKKTTSSSACIIL